MLENEKNPKQIKEILRVKVVPLLVHLLQQETSVLVQLAVLTPSKAWAFYAQEFGVQVTSLFIGDLA